MIYFENDIVQHEIENLTGVKMLYNIHYVK